MQNVLEFGVANKVICTNWKGVTGERTIVPRAIWFGATEWHPEPQWLLAAWDVEKDALRDFSLASIVPLVKKYGEANAI